MYKEHAKVDSGLDTKVLKIIVYNNVEKQPTSNQVTKGYATETRLTVNLHSGIHIDEQLFEELKAF